MAASTQSAGVDVGVAGEEHETPEGGSLSDADQGVGSKATPSSGVAGSSLDRFLLLLGEDDTKKVMRCARVSFSKESTARVNSTTYQSRCIVVAVKARVFGSERLAFSQTVFCSSPATVSEGFASRTVCLNSASASSHF